MSLARISHSLEQKKFRPEPKTQRSGKKKGTPLSLLKL
jgi:hypothetical protein